MLGLILYVGKCSPANIAPNLLDATLVRELKGIIAGAAGDVTFDVLDLPGWSDAERHQLFQFVHSVRARARVRVGDKVYANLFEAALAAMVGTTDLAEHARSLQAAKEAAALLHPTLVEAAAARIDGRLTELGASNVNARTLASEIRTLARNHGAAGSAARPAGRRRPRGPNGTRARRQGPDRPEGKPVIVYLVSGIWMKAVWAGPGRDLEAVSARLGAHPRLRDSKFVCPKPSPERPELASARREIKRHLFGTSGDLIASIAATTAAAAPSHSAGRDKAK